MAMLEVKDINVYYGLIHALRDVSFEVNEGEVVALIGANGAGKTTTLHTVTGLLPSKGGTVTFEGKDITHKPGHAIVKLGMSHVLLDEPSMGLSPLFVGEIFKIIEEVSKAGTTVLLVEQNAKKALSIADRGYVLETGKIVKTGKAADLLNDDSIKKAYLGE